MLNFRNLAIFGFLVALVLVGAAPGDDEKIKHFGNFVDLVKKVNKGKLPSGIYDYKEINQLNEVEDELKLLCLEKFGNGKTPQNAYVALHYACCDYVVKIKDTIPTHYDKIGWNFTRMMKTGSIIQFSVHKKKAEKYENEMKAEINRLRKYYIRESMTNDEARIWVILHNYDSGIFGNLYPKEGRSNKLKMPKIETSGDYLPFEKCFENFIKLVKKVKEKPTDTNDYNEIDLLKDVNHDFKIQCLREFEAQYSTSFEENTPKGAYEVLDYLCKEYVCGINVTLYSLHRFEIYEFISSLMKKGEIIQFLVNEMNTEIDKVDEQIMTKLKKKYGMSDREAKLRVIIYKNYDRKTFGIQFQEIEPRCC